VKNILLIYAKHMKRADESILDLVDKIDSDARAQDCGSYFKNIGGILISSNCSTTPSKTRKTF
jgi:hypothetical protein